MGDDMAARLALATQDALINDIEAMLQAFNVNQGVFIEFSRPLTFYANPIVLTLPDPPVRSVLLHVP